MVDVTNHVVLVGVTLLLVMTFKPQIPLLFLFLMLICCNGDYEEKEDSEDLESVDKNQTLMERQIPEAIVYDLAGRKTLVTSDSATDKYLTFKVKEDKQKFPYILDPETGDKWLVYSSQYRKDLEIYRMLTDEGGKTFVIDWESMAVQKVYLNKYGDVELEDKNGPEQIHQEMLENLGGNSSD